ncbi:hypothetical protein ATB93_17675 [Sphingomonas sp. WG]|nr:hypothetical protein ATB93_17675 [Sphingomonas sp. WG]
MLGTLEDARAFIALAHGMQEWGHAPSFADGNVSVIQRDKLHRADGKLDPQIMPREDFVAEAAAILESIQQGLNLDADDRLDSNVRRDVSDFGKPAVERILVARAY